MTVPAGLCWSWSELPKTGFLALRLMSCTAVLYLSNTNIVYLPYYGDCEKDKAQLYSPPYSGSAGLGWVSLWLQMTGVLTDLCMI